MYCLYLLALFLFLGVNAKRLTDHDKGKNDAISFQAKVQSQRDFSTITSSLVLNPKQMNELENALNNLVSKFLGPQKKQLSLRSTVDGNAGLIYTVRITSDAICKQIKKLFERFGLSQATKPQFFAKLQPNNPSLKVALYHHLLRVPLTLWPILRDVQTRMTNYLQKKEYIKMGYKSSKLELRMDHGTSTDQLKISAILGVTAAYASSVNSCLEEKVPASFDLKKALGKLTNFSPEVTGKMLKNRLEKPIPKSPGKNRKEYNQFHAFICHAAVEDTRLDFDRCLLEVKRVDKCVHKKVNSSSEVTKPATKFSNNFLQTIKSLDDSCKNADKGMDVLVDCKLKTKATSSHFHILSILFPYIIDFFMGNLKKSPALGHMAMNLGSIITKSPVGSEALNEVVTLIEIYKHGVQKKAGLMKAAQRDVRQRSIFTKISSVLSEYKKNILDITNRTVTHVHTVMSNVGKILFETASIFVGEDLSANVKALRCWSGFMDSVLIDWSQNRSEFPAISIAHQKMDSDKFVKDSKRSRSRGLIIVPNEVGFIKSPHEEPLNKLIDSMKRLGQPGPLRRSTALMSLANIFILATMFYECIALLAAAVYRDDSSSMSPSISAETDESDRWQSSRDRRSPSPIDYEDLQPHGGKDEEGPLSLTNEMDKLAGTTVNPNYERNQQNVKNSSDTEIPEKLVTNRTQSSAQFLT